MDAGHRETDELLEEMEERIKKEYRQAVKETQEKAEKYFKSFSAKDEAWRAKVAAGEVTEKEWLEWRKGQFLVGKRWEEMRDTLAEDFHNSNLIARSIVNGYMPEVYALNHNYATFEIEKGSLLDTSYTLYDRYTVERLMREGDILKTNIGKTTENALQEAFKRTGKDFHWQQGQIQSVTFQAIVQGESIPNMAKRIARTMGEVNKAATVRYARTATTAAENTGRIDGYRRAEEMGIKIVQQWLATLDNRTRHSHRMMDGETCEVGEKFSNGCEFPGDPDGPDEEIWNCRCSLRAIVEGLEPKARELRSDAALGGMTYEEWKEGKDLPPSRRVEYELKSSATSIGDLVKPERPYKSEYGGYTDDYAQARERYKAEKEAYDAKIDKAVEASLNATAFKDYSEVEAWAKANGISIDADVASSIDVRSFNEVKPTLDEMFRRFPEVKEYAAEGFAGERLTFGFSIGTTDDGLLSANGGLNFSLRSFKNYEVGLRSGLEGIADGTLVRGDGSFATLVRHEYGHNVQSYIETQIRDKYHMNVDDWRLNYATFDAYKSAQTQFHDEFHRYQQELLDLVGKGGASEYSNTNTLELFAEGFAEWSSGGKSEFGTAFGEFFKRWY